MRLTSMSGKRPRHDVLHRIGQRAGGLDAGRAGADDDEVQGTLVDPVGVGVGLLDQLDQPGAQRPGLLDVVERKRMFAGAGRAVEVRLGSGRQDQVVAGEGLAVGGRDRPAGEIDVRDLGAVDPDGRVALEDASQRAGDVGRGQLRRRHLVEERLELVEVVAVDDRHGQAVLGQLLGAADTGEPATDDDDGRLRLVHAVHLPTRHPQRHHPLWMITGSKPDHPERMMRGRARLATIDPALGPGGRAEESRTPRGAHRG